MVRVPINPLNVNDKNILSLNEQEARDLFLVLEANITEQDGTGGKYITSKCLDTIREIKINFQNKLAVRARDEEINTFDMVEDINALYLLHKIENEEMSHVMRVRKKQKC